jgi:hypothetical protein
VPVRPAGVDHDDLHIEQKHMQLKMNTFIHCCVKKLHVLFINRAPLADRASFMANKKKEKKKQN